jgi:hypothetical protein
MDEHRFGLGGLEDTALSVLAIQQLFGARTLEFLLLYLRKGHKWADDGVLSRRKRASRAPAQTRVELLRLVQRKPPKL